MTAAQQTNIESLVEQLAWDSNFWGFPIAQVKVNALSESDAQRIETWCVTTGIRCVYWLAEVNHQPSLTLAAQFGYQLVDVRQKYSRSVPIDFSPSHLPIDAQIRKVKSSDVPLLKHVAADSYQATRFYFDPHFDREGCSRFYQTWIERSCDGYADVVLVAEKDDQPVGYISGHIDHGAQKSARIGLVGIAPHMQGQGIGQALVDQFLLWASQQGLSRSTVVTQGRNIGAQRTYQRCGFLSESVHLWHHKWFG